MNKIIPSMLGQVVKSIFEKPNTRKYPSVKIVVPEGFRGKQVLDPEKCISCGLCARDCPSGAIKMTEFGTKTLPVFLLDRCVFCYQCADSCPRNAIATSKDFELASTKRADLVVNPPIKSQPET